MFSRLTHNTARVRTLLLSRAERYSIVGMNDILFTCSPVDGPLGCFHFLATMNNAALNIFVQFLWMCIFIYLGCTPKESK